MVNTNRMAKRILKQAETGLRLLEKAKRDGRIKNKQYVGEKERLKESIKSVKGLMVNEKEKKNVQ